MDMAVLIKGRRGLMTAIGDEEKGGYDSGKRWEGGPTRRWDANMVKGDTYLFIVPNWLMANAAGWVCWEQQ